MSCWIANVEAVVDAGGATGTDGVTGIDGVDEIDETGEVDVAVAAEYIAASPHDELPGVIDEVEEGVGPKSVTAEGNHRESPGIHLHHRNY